MSVFSGGCCVILMATGEEMTAYSHVFILHVHSSSTTLVFQAGRLQDTAKPASPLADAVIELCSSTVPRAPQGAQQEVKAQTQGAVQT